MRWTWQHVHMLAGELLTQAASLHSLSRRHGITRGALRRLRVRLPLLTMLVRRLSLEAGVPDGKPHTKLDPTLLRQPARWPSWHEFAWQLRHALYPLIRHANGHPHDSYHPSG